MFNFTVYGNDQYNFYIVYDSPITFTVSDNFDNSNYVKEYWPDVPSELYSRYGENLWSQTEKDTVKNAFGTIQNFVNIEFSYLGDFDKNDELNQITPGEVGKSTGFNINVSVIYNNDGGSQWSGLSLANIPISTTGYSGSEGDVYLNVAYLRERLDFTEFSQTSQILMHEILHSLGLSHPHSYKLGSHYTLAEYTNFISENRSLFNKLGFQELSLDQFDSEIFTLMSYKDETQNYIFNAYTPMLLDILALQSVYGSGRGTSGEGNDLITAGNVGYRSYFDPSGVDTLDLSLYSETGAVVFLGFNNSISGHKIGAVYSYDEYVGLRYQGTLPQSIRWLIGDIENVIGSDGADGIRDNSLDNNISLGAGDDVVLVYEGGDDSIDGGSGNDLVSILMDGDGSDYIDGGEGIDYVSIENDIFDVVVIQQSEYQIVLNYGYQSLNINNVENIALLVNGNSKYYSVSDLLKYKNNGITPKILSITANSDVTLGKNTVTFTFNEPIIVKDYFADLYIGNDKVKTFSSAEVTIDDNDVTVDISEYVATGGAFVIGLASEKITDLDGNKIDQGLLNFVIGDEDENDLEGSANSDFIAGYGGNDILSGSAGDDILDGGEGIDVAVFNQQRSQFLLTKQASGYRISGSETDDSDSIRNIERLAFIDKNVALDLDGHAGEAVKTLGAFLGAEESTNPALVGLALSLLDAGMTYDELLQATIDFIFGAEVSVAAMVDHLSTIVTGQSASPELIAEFGVKVEIGDLSVVGVAKQFTESESNLTNIDLIGLNDAGVEYILV